MLWEGLDLAIDQLLENSKKYNAPLRIIVVTDGGASSDRHRVPLMNRLVAEGIRLDVIIIGTEKDAVPPAIASGVKITGGYLFKVKRAVELHSVIEHPAFFDPAIRKYGNFSEEHPDKVLRRFSGRSKKELLTGDDDASDEELESITVDTSLRLTSSFR
jgi:acetylornithine deacetylase/succinyl-diaminopimelate desuccinylase-like protein